MLFAIGVPRARIVGITRYCDYPPDSVAGCARIGGIVDPSIEAIIALHPDLVLATRGNPDQILEKMRVLGLPVFAFDSQDGLDRVLRTMQETRALVYPDESTPEQSARADSEIASFRRALSRLRSISESIPRPMRPLVFYFDPISPDWTAGRGTHISEAISIAGGENLGDRSTLAWPRYNVEALLADQPSQIVFASADNDTSRERLARSLAALRNRPGWRGLEAVMEGKVCLVPADWLMRPGPRILLAVRRMGACFHPERDWMWGE